MKMTVKLIEEPYVELSNKEWQLARQYMKNGYHIIDRPQGKIILEKYPKIIVEIETDDGKIHSLDFRNRLIQFYGNELSNIELYENFKRDIESRKVELKRESYGYYLIKVDSSIEEA